MKLTKKLHMGLEGLFEQGPITIVALGDSVTHGATYVDTMHYDSVYWNLLKRKLNTIDDYIPVNVINAAISGTCAKDALPRLEKQVFLHDPDLVIICFGLNDVNFDLETYLSSLETIFRRCLDGGVDAIFMTPNMLNTYVAEGTHPRHLEYAAVTAEMQNSGKMDRFIYSAMELANSMGIPVCDCYSKWKELSKTEDTTLLLANRINHPVPQMHELFAESLFQMILADIDAEQ